ncbi:flagellar biosynthesis protein FliP [Acetobacter orientalis]|uniref:Flagellar biosynthesis protein FliP n=1 Tax=Acetobacter orientalis TaxID=146474 RepID=A0A2Z5ZFD3_9PROT|nr:flagellar biosynthesis protein FliP [Acetobacter orientalis]
MSEPKINMIIARDICSSWRKHAALVFVLALAALLLPECGYAQSLTLDMGKGATDVGTTSHLIQLTALITVLSLAPSLLVMVTAFTRIIVVLSLLRGALGAQGTPLIRCLLVWRCF